MPARDYVPLAESVTIATRKPAFGAIHAHRSPQQHLHSCTVLTVQANSPDHSPPATQKKRRRSIPLTQSGANRRVLKTRKWEYEVCKGTQREQRLRHPAPSRIPWRAGRTGKAPRPGAFFLVPKKKKHETSSWGGLGMLVLLSLLQ